jgi:hypothetical protein
MPVALIVLCVAAGLIAAGFVRVWALRRQWREQPPPSYSRPYQRWKDEDDR